MGVPKEVMKELQPGDLILSGSGNKYSFLTRRITRSRFGHATTVTSDGRFLESTDYALTLREDDDGVFILTPEEFRERTKKYSRLKVLRPRSLDRDAFHNATNHIMNHAPSYPTVGVSILGICCLLTGVTTSVPGRLGKRFIDFQLRLATDGTNRMHCAELIVRVYEGSGLNLDFESPALHHLIEHAQAKKPDLLPLPTVPRRAVAGRWPRSPLTAAPVSLIALIATLRDRVDPATERDYAGLIVPADFETLTSFDPVTELTRKRSGWQPVQAVR